MTRFRPGKTTVADSIPQCVRGQCSDTLPVEGTARSFNPFLFYSHSFLVRLFVARTPTGDVSAIEDHSRGGSCAAWTRVRGETGAETILLCLVNSNDKKESNKRASCVTLKCDPKTCTTVCHGWCAIITDVSVLRSIRADGNTVLSIGRFCSSFLSLVPRKSGSIVIQRQDLFDISILKRSLNAIVYWVNDKFINDTIIFRSMRRICMYIYFGIMVTLNISMISTCE